MHETAGTERRPSAGDRFIEVVRALEGDGWAGFSARLDSGRIARLTFDESDIAEKQRYLEHWRARAVRAEAKMAFGGLVDAAVRAEREACIQICREVTQFELKHRKVGDYVASQDIKQRIRARIGITTVVEAPPTDDGAT